MRTLVVVDGEHYPPVVRAAIGELSDVVGVALLGGNEKLPAGGFPDLGVPLVTGDSADRALEEGLRLFRPDVVVDLSDEPVVDGRTRLRLAARALVAGARYQGADFRFDPPPRPRLASKPSIAVIGTGKRTGKTAVSAQVARVLARGGPSEPEVVDPATFDLSAKALLALADSGRHAASDHLEDAVTAGVVTVGTRRCGGGMAGTPAYDTFAAGVAAADGRPEELVIFEGSGQAVPPVHADATVCVVPASADADLVVGHLGAYRLLLSDLIVITMTDQANGGAASLEDLERSVRRLSPGVRVVHTVFRPDPLEPISGRRVVYVTTAPLPAMASLAEHLQREHDCMVVATSPHLGHREELRRDLESAPDADVLVVELKGAAVDVGVRAALARGMDVVFCANRVVSVGGDGDFRELAVQTAALAENRFRS
ncbi:MAG: 2,3-diphosphoglycerate synthetase [Actinobacteria bacterium]|nr:MAG: 2,3-diphosphoglycerate synthetase [Actinomycetota bacterium]